MADIPRSVEADSEADSVSNSNKGKTTKVYHRHTSRQIQALEAECPHPDDTQRRALGRDLGMDPKQIKFWFQNKRTQTKAQCERADNSALRAENERIQCENHAIREALKNIICPSCGGPPFGEEERQSSLEKLKLENAQLKEEHEKVSDLLSKYIGRPIAELDLMPLPPPTSINLLPAGSFMDLHGEGSSATDLGLNPVIPDRSQLTPEMERKLMFETAANALEELVKLLRINEPLWIKSSVDGRYVMHENSYDKIFPKPLHFKSSSARVESSKDSGQLQLNAARLVDLVLDPETWKDLFTSVVNKCKTVQVLEAGMVDTRNGLLELIYEEEHILSPLVAAREFYLLRHCRQIEPGVWVIVNASYDLQEDARWWKFPSGCLIQDLPNGCSQVTWVEHVEVDDKAQTHRLYRDLIIGSCAYGAERWISTLQRSCERLACSMGEVPPITMPDGRRGIMKLGHRMVKSFCSTLNMTRRLDFPQLSETNNSGVRVSVRHNADPGLPNGLIVSAATSLWLPLLWQTVFGFFKDENMRVQWDVLSNGNPANEIAHISTGPRPGNFISVIRPIGSSESNMLILEESCSDHLGGMIVYAPMDIPAMNLAIAGEETSAIPLLPSGFIVSSNGRPGARSTTGNSGGSLLTVAFQILVSSLLSSKDMNMEAVATVNTLISSTVQKIKAALNCANLD